ncbi:hypothetical protein INR49_019979 [Caranx melampygus]|nr:hypothetical protein INR49_019979 [Caranx melampygus]
MAEHREVRTRSPNSLDTIWRKRRTKAEDRGREGKRVFIVLLKKNWAFCIQCRYIDCIRTSHLDPTRPVNIDVIERKQFMEVKGTNRKLV